MVKRILSGLAMTILLTLTFTSVASAHVVVMPDKVAISQKQIFVISVPTEEDASTVRLRLLVPDGVGSVTPTQKPGWQITIVKEADKVTEIDWANGQIGAGLRDEFTFSALAPAKAGDINWKVYQTYQDGMVVSWDQAPTESEEEGVARGPYSVTSVVDDLSGPAKTEDKKTADPSNTSAIVISGAALAVSTLSLFKVLKPKD